MSDNTASLPTGWARAKLGEILHIVRGISFHKEAKEASPGKGLIACLRTTNVQREVEWDDLWFVPQGLVKRDEQLVRPYDILISTANSLELVGKVSLVKGVPHIATLGAFISLIRVPPDLDPSYIYYLLASNEVQQKIRDTASTTTNISNVSTKKLADLLLPVAPLAEQRRAVSEIEKHFSRLDASVAGLKRVRTNMGRYRASVLKAASEGRLVPSEAELARVEGREYEPAEKLISRILEERRARWEEEQLARMKERGAEPKNDKWKAKYQEPIKPDTEKLEPLPEGWCYASLDQLTHFITSGSRGWAAHYSETGHIFIRSQDINTDRLVLDSVARVSVPDGAEGRRTRVAQHDILVTITGANVTKAARVVQDPGEAYVSQHVALIRPVSGDTTPYVYVWVISPTHGRGRLEKAAYGAGKPGLNLDNLRELPVALPPADEQKRIAAEVERRLSVADEAEAVVETNLRRAERLRQAILKRAFGGRLVAQDPADEPAALLLERIKTERAAAAAATAPTKGGHRGRRGRGQSGLEWPQAEESAPTGAAAGAGEG